MFTDNKNFYPTPDHVIEKMITSIKDLTKYELFSYNNKTNAKILEPSAGKGNIINYLVKHHKADNYKIEVMENDSNLQAVLLNQQYQLIHDDFLSYNYTTNYDLIIMNPPFDQGDKHLLKAIELGQKQFVPVTISCLLNTNTLNNTYSNTRTELMDIITTAISEGYGKREDLGEIFASSERKTNVAVSLITLKITPNHVKSSIDLNVDFWENMKKSSTNTTTELAIRENIQEIGFKKNEIMSSIVSYHELKKQLVDVYINQENFNNYLNYTNNNASLIGSDDNRNFYSLFFSNPREELNQKMASLRSTYWRIILRSDSFRKVLTNQAADELMETIENITNMEITEFSVNYLLQALSQNYSNMMESAVIAYFDKVTKYSYNENYSKNIYLYNGWKTNKPHAINEKIILPITTSWYHNNPLESWVDKDGSMKYEFLNYVQDLDKMAEIISPEKATLYEKSGLNTFENNFFKLKLYKKGTVHITFKNKNVLTQLNYMGAKNKNWLPTEEEMQTDNEAKEYMNHILKGKTHLLLS